MARTKQAPVNPSASYEARALLSYLYDLSEPDTGILTGMHTWMEAPGANIANLAQPYTTGDTYPAVCGYELATLSGQSDATANQQRINTANNAEAWHKAGGIVTMMCHMWNPFKTTIHSGKVSPKDWLNVGGSTTDAEFNAICTLGTTQNNMILDEIDRYAIPLKMLRDKKVPVLWRPFHEMNGYWFWWCNKPASTTKKSYIDLWEIMYQRLTVYHGLNNLLWVWNGSGQKGDAGLKAYAPHYVGHNRCDVLGTDVYHDQRYFPNPSMVNYDKAFNHDTLWALGGGKPLALCEVGRVPTYTSGGIVPTQPRWAWCMAWGDSNWSAENTSGQKTAFFNHALAILRHQVVITGISTETPTTPPDSPMLTGISINETLIYGIQPKQLTVTGTYTGGSTSTAPITNSTWTTSNEAVATVTQAGVVTFLNVAGTVTITASILFTNSSGAETTYTDTVTVVVASSDVSTPPVDPEPEPEIPPTTPLPTGNIPHVTIYDIPPVTFSTVYPPQKAGQIAIVNGLPYIAKDNKTNADWIPFGGSLKSPNGVTWVQTIDNAGTPNWTPLSGGVVAPEAGTGEPNPLPSGIIYENSFDGTNNLATLGTGWSNLAFRFGILDGYAVNSDNNDGAFATYDLGVSDYELTVKIIGQIGSTVSTSIPEICVRSSGHANFLSVTLYNGAVRLQKRSSGAQEQLVSEPTTTTNGVEYEVKIRINGNRIIIFVGGVQKIDHTLTESNYALYTGQTKIAFKVTGWGTLTDRARYNDLVVRTLV